MSESARERWITEPGDQFLPYATTVWMDEHDHGFRYRVLEQATTLPRAIKRGFAQQGSDDFNVAVIRDGRLVATLWMEEVVDDEPDVLAGIAEQLGVSS